MRYSNAPPSASGRGSGRDNGVNRGSSGSKSQQSVLITDIRGAMSVLHNMNRGLQISCVDVGCWAILTGATDYKCT